jgi:hypothetical protein
MIPVSETLKAKNVVACHCGIRREKSFQNINETVSECRGERERERESERERHENNTERILRSVRMINVT